MAMSAVAEPLVLLVEDEAFQRNLFRRVFQRAGLRVREAATARQAISALHDVKPDLVVLDILLPDSNGHELCKLIRAEFSTMPILMLTSREGTESKVEALDVGADDYVMKSSDHAELVARVLRLLERHRVHQTLTEREKLEAIRKAATTLSHGINNPLQILATAAELLHEQTPRDSSMRELVDKLNPQIKRIKELVSRLALTTRIVTDPSLRDEDILDVRTTAETLEEAPSESTVPEGHYRVMIVDDDPDLRFLVKQSLESTGWFQVTEAQGSDEAFDLARASRPDLMLVDLMMPQVDGFEHCRRLQKDPDLQGVPIIVLTALGSLRDIVKCFELGAANYVLKPFEPARLPEQIFRTLERLGVRGPHLEMAT